MEGVEVPISLTVIRRLFEIFPNLETLDLSRRFSYIQDSHFTKLHTFIRRIFSSSNTSMIPLSTNGYRELLCKPELMVTGIEDEIY